MGACRVVLLLQHYLRVITGTTLSRRARRATRSFRVYATMGARESARVPASALAPLLALLALAAARPAAADGTPRGAPAAWAVSAALRGATHAAVWRGAGQSDASMRCWSHRTHAQLWGGPWRRGTSCVRDCARARLRIAPSCALFRELPAAFPQCVVAMSITYVCGRRECA